MSAAALLDRVAAYYSATLAAHGATPRGADWNSLESQELRFERLLHVCAGATGFTINDYGCGYGALARFLHDRGMAAEYVGFDVSSAMIAEAHRHLAGIHACRLVSERSALTRADFTVASGIFNVKLDTPVETWEAHVRGTVDDIASLSTRGFAFNMLTHHAHPDRRRDDLYYADPLAWFEYCRRHTRRVALLHDYPLWEFTLVARWP